MFTFGFLSRSRYHGRSYASQEFGYRYTVWRDNYAFIEHFNANANASYTLAINDLGDMDYDEIGRRYTGLMSTPPAHDGRAYEEAEKAAKREIEERAVPSSFDWRTENVVTPVRSQGSCGSCYVFTATGAIEGAYKIATGQLTALSDQMLRTASPSLALLLYVSLLLLLLLLLWAQRASLHPSPFAVDCAQGTGNLGCSGGNMEITYSWIINNGGGVSAQSSYPPYTGVQGPCRSSAGNNGATIKAYRTVASGSESDLLVKAAMGPVSVGVNASPRSFAYYSSGTLDDPTCTSTGLNHAVLVIGWGTDASGTDYWLVKNQWGTCTCRSAARNYFSHVTLQWNNNSKPNTCVCVCSVLCAMCDSVGYVRLCSDCPEQEHVRYRFDGLPALLQRRLQLCCCCPFALSFSCCPIALARRCFALQVSLGLHLPLLLPVSLVPGRRRRTCTHIRVFCDNVSQPQWEERARGWMVGERALRSSFLLPKHSRNGKRKGKLWFLRRFLFFSAVNGVFSGCRTLLRNLPDPGETLALTIGQGVRLSKGCELLGLRRGIRSGPERNVKSTVHFYRGTALRLAPELQAKDLTVRLPRPRSKFPLHRASVCSAP